MCDNMKMEEDRDELWSFHTCKSCPYRSKSTFMMCKHGELHSRPRSDPFACDRNTPEMLQCEFCEFGSNLKVDLTEHVRVVHDGKEVDNEIKHILKCYCFKNCSFETHSVLVLTKHLDDCNDVFKINLKEERGILHEADELSGTDNDKWESQSEEQTVKSTIGDNKVLESTQVHDEEFKKSTVTQKKINRKQNCCFYCKQLFSNIARHLELKHSNKPDVRDFIILKKGSLERRQLIDTLRKKGNYNLYSQTLIPSRLPRKGSQIEYVFCPFCKGAYSKLSLRKHCRICHDNIPKNTKSVMVVSKRLTYHLHPSASETLKVVFSRLRDNDDEVKIIKWDPLIISYGNNLCLKLKQEHGYKEIRAKLRLLGRFLIEIKKNCENITDFSSIYNPVHHKHIVTTLTSLARYNDSTKLFETPSVATSISTMLNQVGQHLKNEYIQRKQNERLPQIDDLLRLLHEDCAASINKTAAESVLVMKRSRESELPEADDIRLLYEYVFKQRSKCYERIKREGFSLDAWESLAKYTLTSMQVFNRRRAGESERLTVENVQNYKPLDAVTDKEFLLSLDIDEQQAAHEYTVIRVKGKLENQINIIVDNATQSCLKMILHYRRQAGVLRSNPYVFGLRCVDNKEHKHLSACKLLRIFSEKCGAKNPDLLRGTLLRKRVSTQAAVDLKEFEVDCLSNHSRHKKRSRLDCHRRPETTKKAKILKNCSQPETCDAPFTSVTTETEAKVESLENDDAPISEKGEVVRFLPSCSRNNAQESIGSDESARLPSPVKQRCTTPTIKYRKKAWSTPERTVVHTLFKDTIEKKTLPKFSDCQAAVDNYPDLEDRTAKQLYAYLNNLNKRTSNPDKSQSRITRISWTTQEKSVVKSIFGRYIEKEQLPPFISCEAAITVRPELRNRTAKQLYAYINNIINKNKSKIGNAKCARSSKVAPTPEKGVISQLFKKYIDKSKIPTDQECADTLIKYSEILKNVKINAVKDMIGKNFRSKVQKRST